MRKGTRIQYQKDMDANLKKYGADMAQHGETTEQALDRLAAKGDKGAAMASHNVSALK